MVGKMPYVFYMALYISLGIFGLGLIYRFSVWYRRKIGSTARGISSGKRLTMSIMGIFKVIFSLKVFTFLKAFILDVIFQRKIIKESFSRWIMHLFIYLGGILLLLMHAMHRILSSKIFSGFYSTKNPFMFLRDLFAIMVLVGILIAIFRRFILRVPRLRSSAMDIYMIIIVAVIILTGVFLEGIKITSFARYSDMVRDYGAAGNKTEQKALEAYWVKKFHVVSSSNDLYFNSATLKLGKKVNDLSCSSCHSSPKWAFTGFVTALAIKPVARTMDKAGVPDIVYYIHFFACLLALVYFPFSKMFHILVTPLSLLANSVMDDETSTPANIATRQVMELDACMHCCTCSLRCSALAAFSSRDNLNILPSEKMGLIKKLINRKKLKDKELLALQEGVYICTNCDRCTVVCPAGINLRALWFQVREELINYNGYALPFVLTQLSFYRGLMKGSLNKDDYIKPLENAHLELTHNLDSIKSKNITLSISELDREFLDEIGINGDGGTFSYCFTCSTCTSSCPVVQNYEEPGKVLGLLPHQIIHSTALGLKDLALGSKMIWDCLTCYKCQESCPQGVRVTEVFYKLKNMAAALNLEEIKKEAETNIL
ncbi:4Fe-4S dicluster domain-containing protein [Spirochaetota bacterium]